MGFDYAIVHVKFTIPPALALTLLYRPLSSALDVYKVLFLITVAVVSTIPWDSYLVRNKIWTYPPDAVVGLTLFDIPLEEVFFFFIQTYNTSLLYLILSKATFHPAYLRSDAAGSLRPLRNVGQFFIGLALCVSVVLIRHDGTGTYLGLIFAWAGPFLLLLWTFAYQFLIGLPWSNTVLPIGLPTVYLWIVDTLAMRRGTWVIENGTKLGVNLWPGLEIEEALFFLVTNCLIIFGLVAFDNALAVLYTLTPVDQRIPELPSPLALIKALLVPTSSYDSNRIEGLHDAIGRLKKKSRSFYLASGVFQGKLRIDLILLYSFCRVADDLVDNATSAEEARKWIAKLKRFLELSYGDGSSKSEVASYIAANFPSSAQSALVLLPVRFLSQEPLFELLHGFEMDLAFDREEDRREFPIKGEADLELYSSRVAGTVAHLCLDLVFFHLSHDLANSDRQKLTQAGENMGIALQLVNISRDIEVDAKMKRVYIPNTWLDGVSLSPRDVIEQPSSPKTEQLKEQLLTKAFEIYSANRDAIEGLPEQARGPMRVAVESYMEIGRVLQEGNEPIRSGKATVPRWRRILVAWKALSGPRTCANTEKAA